MRYIIYGAGAVGGVIGGRLFQAGHDVVLVCRGAHLKAIQQDGLHLVTPDTDVRLPIGAVEHPRELTFGAEDVAVLTMKTQDTEGALLDLETSGGADLPVICCQNGVENERLAARRFGRVYGMVVYLWATFLEAGTVIGNTEPVSGILDAGCYPRDVDPLIGRVTADLSGARFVSRPTADIMPVKYAKLLGNLGTAIPAITGDTIGSAPQRHLLAGLRDEAIRCYAAAGVVLPDESSMAELTSRYKRVAVEGYPSGEGSTWQSVARGRDTVETDYLNGEIVLLGRLHGIPTPLNSVVRRLTTQMARSHEQPGRYTADQVEALAADEPVSAAPRT